MDIAPLVEDKSIPFEYLYPQAFGGASGRGVDVKRAPARRAITTPGHEIPTPGHHRARRPSMLSLGACSTFAWMTLIHLTCGVGELASWVMYTRSIYQTFSSASVQFHLFILANLYISAAILIQIERIFHYRRTASLLASLIIIGIGVPSLREILRDFIISDRDLTPLQTVLLFVLPVTFCVIETTAAVYLIVVSLDTVKTRRYLVWRSPENTRVLEIVVVNQPDNASS